MKVGKVNVPKHSHHSVFSLCYCLLSTIGVTLPQIACIITLTPDIKNDLHLPHVSLTMYQKGVFYSGIEVFNALPTTIKDISSNPRRFKVTLKHYLLTHSFYRLH